MMTAVFLALSVVFAFLAGKARTDESYAEMRCMIGLWAITFSLFVERLWS